MAERLCKLLATLALLASLLACVMPKTVWSKEGRRAVLPAVFFFGDSILDVGNNNFLNSTAKANFPFNGIDFPGGTPTGRFSNGYNTADYLAKLYGFEQSPPAFLSLTEPQLSESICNGINFASGGSGILDVTGSNFGEVIPMDVQLQYFRSSLERFSARRCSMPKKVLLSKSIFLLSAGNNDLFRLYSANASQTPVDAIEFITDLTSKFKHQLMTLYGLGARRFGILWVGLIGCVPFFRSQTPSGDCVQVLNDYAFQFSDALRKMLETLSSKCEELKYSFGDGKNFGVVIVHNASAYGFKNTTAACCGEGRLNGQNACTPNATLCRDREEFYFWDLLHPTAAADKVGAELLFGGPPTLVRPVNFGQLVADN